MEAGDTWRPRRRLRHLHGIAARNLVFPQHQPFTQQATEGGRQLEGVPAGWANLQAPRDLAASWAVQCALWAWRPDQPPRHLYTSEQVPGTLSPEWQPPHFDLPPADAALLHDAASGRLHLEVFATRTRLAESAAVDSPAKCGSAAGTTSATLQLSATAPANCSGAATLHIRPSLRTMCGGSASGKAGGLPAGHQAVRQHTASSAAIGRLRTSDSVDSIELRQGDMCEDRSPDIVSSHCEPGEIEVEATVPVTAKPTAQPSGGPQQETAGVGSGRGSGKGVVLQSDSSCGGSCDVQTSQSVHSSKDAGSTDGAPSAGLKALLGPPHASQLLPTASQLLFSKADGADVDMAPDDGVSATASTSSGRQHNGGKEKRAAADLDYASVSPAVVPLSSPFARANGERVEGDSDDGSDYETASEDGGHGTHSPNRARSASPARPRPHSPEGPQPKSALRSHSGQPHKAAAGSGGGSSHIGRGGSRRSSAADSQSGEWHLPDSSSGSKSARVQLLAADVDLERLEFVGAELAEIQAGLPRNTLLLQLPGGWHAHPPPSGALSAAHSLPGSTVEAERSPSMATAFREYVASDAELWQAPLRPPLPPVVEAIIASDSPLSTPRSGASSAVSSPVKVPPAASPIKAAMAAVTAGPGSGTAGQATTGPAVKEVSVQALLSAVADIAEARRREAAAEARRNAARARLEEALEGREAGRRQRLALEAVEAEAARHRTAAAECERQAMAKRRAADLVHKIVVAQAQALLRAVQALQAADARLASADAMLAGERGMGQLVRLNRALVARRARMVAQLASAMGLGFQTVTVMDVPAGGTLATRLDRAWFGFGAGRLNNAPGGGGLSSGGGGAAQLLISLADGGGGGSAAEAPSEAGGPIGSDDGGSDAVETSSAVAESIGQSVREVARLAIGGLELPAGLGKRGLDGTLGWEGDPAEEMRVAAALGYAAAMTERLAAYLDVPLRYPLHCAASASAVMEAPPPAGTFLSNVWPPPPPQQSDQQGGAAEAGSSMSGRAWPLFYAGDRRTRFAYAIFALNKNIEQLLHAHGISSVGPHQVLPNLWTLASAAASALPRPSLTPPDTPGGGSSIIWSAVPTPRSTFRSVAPTPRSHYGGGGTYAGGGGSRCRRAHGGDSSSEAGGNHDSGAGMHHAGGHVSSRRHAAVLSRGTSQAAPSATAAGAAESQWQERRYAAGRACGNRL